MSAQEVCSICGRSFWSNNLRVHQSSCRRKNLFRNRDQTQHSAIDADQEYESYESFDYDTQETEPTISQPDDQITAINAKNAHIVLLRRYFHLNLEHRCQNISTKNVYCTFISISSKYIPSKQFKMQSNWEKGPDLSLINGEVVEIISKLAHSQSQMDLLKKLLQYSNSTDFFQHEMNYVSSLTSSGFERIEVWPDSFFWFRRLDLVITKEFFSDKILEQRYVWERDDQRWKDVSNLIQHTYSDARPFGLVFYSDKATPSSWVSTSFHPLFVRSCNDPEGKYTLLGLFPTKIITNKKSHKSYIKLAIKHKCLEIILNTAPVNHDSTTLTVYSALEEKKIKLKPFIYGLLGDLPELDDWALKYSKPTACRSCYNVDEDLSIVKSSPRIRNLVLEYNLKKSAFKTIRVALEANATAQPKKDPQFILLKQMNMHAIKPALCPKLIGGIPPLIDDLDHTFESGVGENIRENIFKCLPSSLGQPGDFDNLVSTFLRILAQPRFRYPGQLIMASGFEFGKKIANFDARRSLLCDLPFLLKALVSDDHPALHLAIIYLSFRNLIEDVTVADESKKPLFEKARILFCYLYDKLIGPFLKQKAHPKIHRISAHLSWDSVRRFGSMGEWRTKTGESMLRRYKILWHQIGGGSLDNYNRAIIRTFNSDFASTKRPLHVETKQPPYQSDKMIAYKRSKRLTGVREFNLKFLNPVLKICIIETAEKLRMPGTALPIHRDSFIRISPNRTTSAEEESSTTKMRGIVLEFLLNSDHWAALVSIYRCEGKDDVMFGLKKFSCLGQRKVLDLRNYSIRKKSMIPDLRCVIDNGQFTKTDIPLEIPQIWLRKSGSLIVDLEKLVESNQHLQYIEEEPPQASSNSDVLGISDDGVESVDDHTLITFENQGGTIAGRIDELDDLLNLPSLPLEEKIELALDRQAIGESLLAGLMEEPPAKRSRNFSETSSVPLERAARRMPVDYRALHSGSSSK